MRQQEILDFWFADAESSVEALDRRTDVWYGGSRSFDESCHQFRDGVERALRGELDDWAATPSGRLALILLLDQFPRNLFRNSPRAFAGDAKAQALVVEGRRNGMDKNLSIVQRLFLYMPLEHAEDRDLQAQSIEAFEELVRDAPADKREWAAALLPYAKQHRDIIARFGRFPHRNTVLGRESTPEERVYLAADAPNFGQSA
jgi:uncharacterized protein (DUF924 family)